MNTINKTLPRAGATLALAAALGAGPAAVAQAPFATPQSAANTLIEAIATHDGDAVSRLLGSDWKRFVPIGEIDPDDVTAFLLQVEPGAQRQGRWRSRAADRGQRSVDAADPDRAGQGRPVALRHGRRARDAGREAHRRQRACRDPGVARLRRRATRVRAGRPQRRRRARVRAEAHQQPGQARRADLEPGARRREPARRGLPAQEARRRLPRLPLPHPHGAGAGGEGRGAQLPDRPAA